MTEPGQPCVMISGNAFSCCDRTWMKWISTPSISVVNCGSALSFASALAPVVVGRPVARELLQRRQLHALRPVCDELLGGPARRLDAPAQVVELLFGNLDVERPNLGGGLGGRTHGDLRSGRRGGEDILSGQRIFHATPAGWARQRMACASRCHGRLAKAGPAASWSQMVLDSVGYAATPPLRFQPARFYACGGELFMMAKRTTSSVSSSLQPCVAVLVERCCMPGRNLIELNRPRPSSAAPHVIRIRRSGDA